MEIYGNLQRAAFFSFFFFSILFIYLYLAVLGLCCYDGFSLVEHVGATLELQCVDFSLLWFLLLQSMGTV